MDYKGIGARLHLDFKAVPKILHNMGLIVRSGPEGWKLSQEGEEYGGGRGEEYIAAGAAIGGYENDIETIRFFIHAACGPL